MLKVTEHLKTKNDNCACPQYRNSFVLYYWMISTYMEASSKLVSITKYCYRPSLPLGDPVGCCGRRSRSVSLSRGIIWLMNHEERQRHRQPQPALHSRQFREA